MSHYFFEKMEIYLKHEMHMIQTAFWTLDIFNTPFQHCLNIIETAFKLKHHSNII